MKNLFIITFLLIGFNSFSQDTFFQESNPEAKKEAIKITNEYNRELALTGKQQLLFQKKVEKFLIERHKIEKEFSGKEKLNLLLKMQTEETAEMNDVLTRLQLNLYKKIKPNIQPLEIVSQE